jgi:capsule polysaccharide export protein KpsC/LpsZ
MVMSPGHTDQIAVIEGLAKSLPLDATLVVKEHGSMIGRRPSGFYRRIARLPRVAVVPAQWSSFELIRDAALVCAITGTAAWEAALLGVPVLVMGQPHYAYLPQGVMRCTDLSALPETVPAALAQTACPEIDLELFIAAMYQRSFAMPPGFIWGDAPVEPADWDGCARAYARAIIDSLTLEDDHALAR